MAGRMRTASGAFALTRSFAPGWRCSFGGLSNSSRSSPSSTASTLPGTTDRYAPRCALGVAVVSTFQHAFEEDPAYYADRADGLLASAVDGTPSAVAAFTRWSAPLTSPGARLVVARNHGLESWDALRQHIGTLAARPFARAFRLVRAQDVTGLAALLDEFPDLVTAQGTNGNDLLGLASATHDERLVSLLLSRGADVRHGNAHGWTALHQAGYANLPSMAAVLLDAGAPADVSARGAGGTPLVAALFWGHVEVAGVLAAAGVVPGNLRTAAGLDDVALLESLWDTPSAGASRGF